MEEKRQREAVVYCRVELLAMEACMHYKMKNKTEAFAALREAYEVALPNGLWMPFIELNKDMRVLTASALKDSSCKIPKRWLEEMNSKAASYGKRQSYVINKYKQDNRVEEGAFSLSPQETEILADLSQGLSRTEIAASRGLSPNTVKMVTNMIYSKMGAENVIDLVRIAVERKIVS